MNVTTGNGNDRTWLDDITSGCIGIICHSERNGSGAKNLRPRPRCFTEFTLERSEGFSMTYRCNRKRYEIYRLNLSTVTASDLNTAAVPEPSSVLMLGSAA